MVMFCNSCLVFGSICLFFLFFISCFSLFHLTLSVPWYPHLFAVLTVFSRCVSQPVSFCMYLDFVSFALIHNISAEF